MTKISTKKLSIGSIRATQKIDSSGPGDDLHSLMAVRPAPNFE